MNVHRPIYIYYKIMLTCLVYTWRMAFKVLLYTKAPFLRVCTSLLCTYCSKKKLPEWLLLKHGNVYCRLHNYVHGCTDDSLRFNGPLYLLSTLYVTRVIKFSPGSPPLFHTASDEKLNRRLHVFYMYENVGCDDYTQYVLLDTLCVAVPGRD